MALTKEALDKSAVDEYIIKNKLDWYQGNMVKFASGHRSADDLRQVIHYAYRAIAAQYGEQPAGTKADADEWQQAFALFNKVVAGEKHLYAKTNKRANRVRLGKRQQHLLSVLMETNFLEKPLPGDVEKLYGMRVEYDDAESRIAIFNSEGDFLEVEDEVGKAAAPNRASKDLAFAQVGTVDRKCKVAVTTPVQDGTCLYVWVDNDLKVVGSYAFGEVQQTAILSPEGYNRSVYAFAEYVKGFTNDN